MNSSVSRRENCEEIVLGLVTLYLNLRSEKIFPPIDRAGGVNRLPNRSQEPGMDAH